MRSLPEQRGGDDDEDRRLEEGHYLEVGLDDAAQTFDIESEDEADKSTHERRQATDPEVVRGILLRNEAAVEVVLGEM